MIKRVKLLDFPFDVINEVNFEKVIIDLFNNNKHNLIMFVNFKDFIRNRKKDFFKKKAESASLVIPTSNAIIKGLSYFGENEVTAYTPFSFIIKMLGILEKYNKSIYLFGSDYKGIITATQNIRDSYPNLKVVGRYKGSFSTDNEQKIIVEGIKKASPTILFVGDKVKKGQNWLYNNLNKFNPGIFVYSKETFKVIAGKKKSPNEKRWETIPEWQKLNLFKYLLFLIQLKREKKRLSRLSSR